LDGTVLGHVPHHILLLAVLSNNMLYHIQNAAARGPKSTDSMTQAWYSRNEKIHLLF
jgi:hypothetical protein